MEGDGTLHSTNASALRILFNAGGSATTERATVLAGAGGPPCALPVLELTLAEWRSDSFPFRDFDRFAEALAADAPGGAFEIRLSGEARWLAPAARQVVTRCQRLAARRNAASACELFERVLASHRRLHAPTRPQAAPVYAHALDTWQWLLRLDPEAGLVPQLAALFHDVERLVAEPGAAPAAGASGTPGADSADGRHCLAAGAGLACVDDHARHGAWITDELLAELDIDLAARVRVHRLIAGRRRPPRASTGRRSATVDSFATEIALLDDADALSFLAFDSAAYLDELGTEQTARAVADALARLRPASRALLRGLRLRTAVARLAQRELARQAAPGPGGPVAATAATAASGPTGAASVEAAIVIAAGPARGGKPSRATVIARARMAAGLAGGAGIAPTRTGALLARAAALGALAARHPQRVPAIAAAAAGSARRAHSAYIAADGCKPSGAS
jgi:hypothetical protein